MIQLGVGPRTNEDLLGMAGQGACAGNTGVAVSSGVSASARKEEENAKLQKMQKPKQTLAVKDPTSGLPETTSSSLALIKPKVGPVRLRTMKVGM